MGDIRAYSPHKRWGNDEILVLQKMYGRALISEILFALPGRSRRVIQQKANAIGLVRHHRPARTAEEVRAAKRVGMAVLRAKDPEAARQKQKDWHARNRERQNRKTREYATRRFFWNREMHLRRDGCASARELAALWKRQRGCCALTGRRLDRSAHLDHIVPLARGGGDGISNLRWLCHEANLAKRALTDTEFVSLCSDVMKWIGERIAAVERILAMRKAAE